MVRYFYDMIHTYCTCKWDTAGQERFRTITTSYYRHSHGILLVYDITDEVSFENIRSWITQINAHADPDTNVLIIGNKRDLEKQRVSTLPTLSR